MSELLQRIQNRIRYLRRMAHIARLASIASVIPTLIAISVSLYFYDRLEYLWVSSWHGATDELPLVINYIDTWRAILVVGMWAVALIISGLSLLPSILLFGLSELLIYLADDHAINIRRRSGGAQRTAPASARFKPPAPAPPSPPQQEHIPAALIEQPAPNLSPRPDLPEVRRPLKREKEIPAAVAKADPSRAASKYGKLTDEEIELEKLRQMRRKQAHRVDETPDLEWMQQMRVKHATQGASEEEIAEFRRHAAELERRSRR